MRDPPVGVLKIDEAAIRCPSAHNDEQRTSHGKGDDAETMRGNHDDTAISLDSLFRLYGG